MSTKGKVRMHVHHVSRQNMCDQFKYGINYDVISISDTNREKDLMRKQWLHYNKDPKYAALFLNFIDSEVDNLFTEHKAMLIKKFVNESHKKGKNIIVHCFAGLSRSGAVAKFISDYLGIDEDYYSVYNLHNKDVYYKLLEYSGIPTKRSYYQNLEDSDKYCPRCKKNTLESTVDLDEVSYRGHTTLIESETNQCTLCKCKNSTNAQKEYFMNKFTEFMKKVDKNES